MPKGTRVARCVEHVMDQGKEKGSAIAICQDSTKQVYQTGKSMKKHSQFGFGPVRGLGIGLGRGIGLGAGIGRRMDGTGPHGIGLGPGGGKRTGAGLALKSELIKKSEYLRQIYQNAFNNEIKKQLV